MAYTKPSTINSLWATSGDRTVVPTAKRSTGWVAEKPSYQYFNDILYKLGQANAYTNERGIAEWDNITEYQATKSYVVGSDGNVYKCLVTNTNINPISDDGTNWLQVWNNQGVVKWNISTTYGVSDIVRYTDDESYVCHTPQVAGTLPTDNSAFINLKFYGSYAYAVSQLAGGDASLVGFIYGGQVVDGFDYLIYPDDGRIYSRGTATGTFAGDFNPATGVDSGLTGALLSKSITDLEDRVDTVETDITELSTANNARTKVALNASGDAPIYACRAWVNFNGTGVVSIRDSGNVSSITDNGIGVYTVNFITNMSDTNYSIGAASSVPEITGATGASVAVTSISISAFDVRVATQLSSGNQTGDADIVTCSIFR